MAIREWIGKHQKTVSIGVGAVIVLTAVMIWHYSVPNQAVKPPENAYFTTDDGATYFEEKLTNIPPFDHGGKQAVCAFVLTCDGGSHHWVAYLGKYSPESKKEIESGGSRADPHNMLLKAPGDREWTAASSVDFSKLITPPPGMGSGPVEPVSP